MQSAIGEEGLYEPPDDVRHLLTDAHCHPTDDPRPWDNVDVLCDKLRRVNIGRVCAMSTSSRDQAYVAHLAEELPDKVVPAFGYHPWFSHKIAIGDDAEAHYRQVLDRGRHAEEVEAMVKVLEPPRMLADIVEEVRINLLEHPNALLGEVGIDRIFRLPRDPKGWSREPDGAESHSLGLGRRPLTSLSPSIDHQIVVVKAQIGVAIELGRSVSLHSVRAGGALMQLFDDLDKAFPGDKLARMSKRERRKLVKERETDVEDDPDEGARQASFGDINIDLHSCTLSAEMISQLQKKYANVFVSFSLAINARQRDIHTQLRACDPYRLLIESDWHSAEDLGARCWTMLRLATDTIGPPLAPEDDETDEKYKHAAAFLHNNWLRFVRQ